MEEYVPKRNRLANHPANDPTLPEDMRPNLDGQLAVMSSLSYRAQRRLPSRGTYSGRFRHTGGRGIGYLLAYLRERDGLSVMAAAAVLDLTEDVLQAYEEGRARPPSGELSRIAGLYGVSPRLLISG